MICERRREVGGTAVRPGVSTRVDCYYLVAYGYSVSSGYSLMTQVVLARMSKIGKKLRVNRSLNKDQRLPRMDHNE